MKLKIRDMQAETDKVAEKNCLDLLDISTAFSEEEHNQLFQWVRHLHLDDEDGNPNPRIVAHVREAGVDVDRVLSEHHLLWLRWIGSMGLWPVGLLRNDLGKLVL